MLIIITEEAPIARVPVGMLRPIAFQNKLKVFTVFPCLNVWEYLFICCGFSRTSFAIWTEGGRRSKLGWVIHFSQLVKAGLSWVNCSNSICKSFCGKSAGCCLVIKAINVAPKPYKSEAGTALPPNCSGGI